MDSVALKSDIDDMKSEIVAQTKSMFQEAVDSVWSEFLLLKGRVEMMEAAGVPKQEARKFEDETL